LFEEAQFLSWGVFLFLVSSHITHQWYYSSLLVQHLSRWSMVYGCLLLDGCRFPMDFSFGYPKIFGLSFRWSMWQIDNANWSASLVGWFLGLFLMV
jgi:hypothetical protein